MFALSSVWTCRLCQVAEPPAGTIVSSLQADLSHIFSLNYILFDTVTVLPVLIV